MKKFILILLLFPCVFLYGQGEIDDEVKVFHRNESTVHATVTTSGWGFGYQHGKRKDGFRKRLWDVEFMEIKHPREVKITYGLNRSVYGKHNCFYSLSLNFGQQREYFSKLDKGGVAIRHFYLAGISLGIRKPVYYYVVHTDPQTGEEIVELELFNTDNSHGTYYSDAPFIIGIGEISFIPGIHLKSGISFEYGKTDKKIRAIELGAYGAAFPKKIDIMATDDNTWYFLGLFLQIRIGRITGKY